MQTKFQPLTLHSIQNFYVTQVGFQYLDSIVNSHNQVSEVATVVCFVCYN